MTFESVRTTKYHLQGLNMYIYVIRIKIENERDIIE